MAGTYITASTATAKSLIAAADIDSADPTHIVPRNDLKNEDFGDLWWVGDYSDKNGEKNGGFMAIHLKNALSTGGFSVKTANKSKGQYAFTYTAHYSMEKQDEVPFEVYIKSGTDEAA